MTNDQWKIMAPVRSFPLSRLCGRGAEGEGVSATPPNYMAGFSA